MEVKPKIGANVLETLTTGMYTNPLDTIREFVQNASDSIRNAEHQGILNKNDGRITIDIDKRKRRLVVHDNGLGVPENEIQARLINIGMSDKSIIHDAGFRGIGRLAGIAYCDNLIFRTSSKGNKRITNIEINSKFIREATRPSKASKKEAQDIMSENTIIKYDNSNSEDHFFEVIMDGITNDTSTFLDWSKLESYLAQVAPVDYDAQIFSFAPKIKKWIEDQKMPIPVVSLVIRDIDSKNEREVRKPYRQKYQIRKSKNNESNSDFKIYDIEYYPKRLNAESTFWMWYGVSDLLGQIKESEAGLRVRKNNIELGGPNIAADIFEQISITNRRFNAYFIGEIHILTSDAIPNARRDGFEDLDAWPAIRGEIKGVLSNLCEKIRQSSKDRNLPTHIITTGARKSIQISEGKIEEGLVSENERKDLLTKIDKHIFKVKSAMKHGKNVHDDNKLAKTAQALDEIKDKLENTNSFVSNRKDLDLTKNQKVVLQDVLEIIYKELSNDSCKKKDECYNQLKDKILSKFENTK